MAVDPPYAGGTVERIESEFWRLRWLAAKDMLAVANDRENPLPQLMDHANYEFSRLAAIEDCWLSDTCPRVEGVQFVWADGPLSTFVTLPLTSSLVDAVFPPR